MQYKVYQGTVSHYNALHNWVRKHKGKPTTCVVCSKDYGRICWANISGKYLRDLDDYEAMCFSCNILYDSKLRDTCKAGHEYTPENTRLRTRGVNKWRVCRECQRSYVDKWRSRKDKLL